MKINSLKISGVSGINELELNFNERFNVICGANGVGKSTILNVIIDYFCVESVLKRNAKADQGGYSIEFISNEPPFLVQKSVVMFEPNRSSEGPMDNDDCFICNGNNL